MHTLHKEAIVPEMFSIESIKNCKITFNSYLSALEALRSEYLKTLDRDIWKELIQMLPNNFNQKRTVSLNLEVLRNMYLNRSNHKLSEWRDFINTLKEKELINALAFLEKERKAPQNYEEEPKEVKLP